MDMSVVHQRDSSDWPLPAMMAGIAIDGKIWLASSSKTDFGPKPAKYPADFPEVLKKAMDDCVPVIKHRRRGACAEPMVLAYYIAKTGKSDFRNVHISAYGTKKSGEGFHKVCDMDADGYGCDELIKHLGIIDVDGLAAHQQRSVAKRDPVDQGRPVPKGTKCRDILGSSCAEPSSPSKNTGSHKPSASTKSHKTIATAKPQKTTGATVVKSSGTSKTSQPKTPDRPKGPKSPRGQGDSATYRLAIRGRPIFALAANEDGNGQ